MSSVINTKHDLSDGSNKKWFVGHHHQLIWVGYLHVHIRPSLATWYGGAR